MRNGKKSPKILCSTMMKTMEKWSRTYRAWLMFVTMIVSCPAHRISE